MADHWAGGEPRESVYQTLPHQRAVDVASALVPGGRVVGLTKGQFSALDLLRAVIDKIGPSDVGMSTWTAGIRDLEVAKWLITTGQIVSMRFLVDRSFVTRQPAYCAAMVRAFGADCIRMTNTHAKFVVIRAGKWRISLRSSMNLNKNARIEQYDLDDCAEMYGFFDGFLRECWAKCPGPEFSGAELEAGFRSLFGAEITDSAPSRGLDAVLDWDPGDIWE